MTDYILSLSIAGLTIALTTNSAALHAALRRRYQSYIIDASAPSHMVLEFDANRPQITALADRPFKFRPDAVDFVSPAYRGTIDLARHHGYLSIVSPAAEEDADYFVRTAYALLVFQTGGLLFHAAGIVRRQRAFVFFGQSGSGKTTVSRLSPDDLVLNDDLVLLQPDASNWQVHATPFSNPTQFPPARPCAAPLALLLRLVQDQRTYLEPLSPSRRTAEMIAATPLVSADPNHSAQLFDRVAALAAATPIFNLHFLPNASFWPVIDMQLAAYG